MTRKHSDRRAFGFAAQLARADLTGFTRWYDRRCLLDRPSMAECEASLSRPDDDSMPMPMADAQMRDAA